MNISLLRKLLNTSCRIYTVCTLLLCVVQLLVSDEDMLINPSSFLLLFPFAICVAGADLLYHAENRTPGVRFFAHFAVLTVGVMLFLFWPAGVFSSGKSALIMVFLYLLFYLLVMLAINLIRNALRRHTVARTSYSSQYSTKREKNKGR